jgi:hypothetical protein
MESSVLETTQTVEQLTPKLVASVQAARNALLQWSLVF